MKNKLLSIIEAAKKFNWLVAAIVILVGAGVYLLFQLKIEQKSPTPVPPVSSPVSDGCLITGCSGEVCSDEEVVTICIFKPEHACYDRARCERQADGKCGWTMTDELALCLYESREERR